MKKFRNRKTGEEITYKDGVIKSGTFTLEIGCEPSAEYWEEKQYEILSFINSEGDVFYLNDKGYYDSSIDKKPETWRTLEHILETTSCKIHSVKRISDGEVFNLEDYVQYDSEIDSNLYPELLRPYKIDKFNIDSSNRIIARGYNEIDNVINNACITDSKNFRKVKPILFTSFDGKQIREGDDYFKLRKSTLEILPSFKDTEHVKRDILNFSTKEAAQEYIILNAKCLSLKEVGQFYNKLLDFSNGNSKGLRELVKQKLGL